MSKTIEIEKGDTFFRSDSGSAGIQRGDKWRWLSTEWFFYQHGYPSIALSEFRTIAAICGYTVVEKQPEPEAVVVTHGVQNPHINGLLTFIGTLDACRKFANGTQSGVVPIRFGGASNA